MRCQVVDGPNHGSNPVSWRVDTCLMPSTFPASLVLARKAAFDSSAIVFA